MVANLNTTVNCHSAIAIYCGTLTIENVGTVVNYWGIFITLAPGVKVIKIPR